MKTYQINIPFNLEINTCIHCGQEFSIIAPAPIEFAGQYWFQGFNFCPYCGEKPEDTKE